MRMKKLVLGMLLSTAIMGVGATINTESVHAKRVVINVNKNNLENAKAKVVSAYDEGNTIKVKYKKYKFKKQVYKHLDSHIKETANVEWIPENSEYTFSNAKKLKDYKQAVEYLSLICDEIRTQLPQYAEKYHSRAAANPSLSHLLTYYTVDSEGCQAENLESYIMNRCEYSDAKKYAWKYDANANDFRSLYEGNFKGVCQDGAELARDIGLALGYEMHIGDNAHLNHAWAVMKVTTDGVTYYKGIEATAFALDIKKLSDAPKIQRKAERVTFQPSEYNFTNTYIFNQ